MSLLRGVWFVLKLLLSAILLILALLSVTQAFKHSILQATAMEFGGGSLFLALAALPWVDFSTKNPSRAMGLISLYIGILMLVMAQQELSDTAYPKDCAIQRRKLTCHALNGLYALGGSTAVAVVPASIALLMIWGSWRTIKRVSNESA